MTSSNFFQGFGLSDCHFAHAPGMEKRAVLEFSRDRKSMSVLWHDASSGSNVLFAKGAPEMLIKRCSKIMMPDGQIEPLTDAWRTQIEKELLKMLGSNNVDIHGLLNNEFYNVILTVKHMPESPVSVSCVVSMVRDMKLHALNYCHCVWFVVSGFCVSMYWIFVLDQCVQGSCLHIHTCVLNFWLPSIFLPCWFVGLCLSCLAYFSVSFPFLFISTNLSACWPDFSALIPKYAAPGGLRLPLSTQWSSTLLFESQILPIVALLATFNLGILLPVCYIPYFIVNFINIILCLKSHSSKYDGGCLPVKALLGVSVLNGSGGFRNGSFVSW